MYFRHRVYIACSGRNGTDCPRHTSAACGLCRGVSLSKQKKTGIATWIMLLYRGNLPFCYQFLCFGWGGYRIDADWTDQLYRRCLHNRSALVGHRRIKYHRSEGRNNYGNHKKEIRRKESWLWAEYLGPTSHFQDASNVLLRQTQRKSKGPQAGTIPAATLSPGNLGSGLSDAGHFFTLWIL